ncbi:MAG TPA: DUF2884 family protein [Rhodanobacteraceae bacterium]|nr:DUF2884 family protein [Rhodanobacteraceae bacterium]
MNRILTLAGAALVTITLAACSPGINSIGHRITFDSSGLVVHATGQPNAHVSRNGDLTIDGKAIAVTAEQRQLLQRYYREASSTMDSGEAIGKQGARMAVRGIGAAIASIFHGDSTGADKRLDAQSQSMEDAASELCKDINTLDATQQAIATQIPAFEPYASGRQMHCVISRSTTTTHASTGSAAASTAIRLSAAPSGGAAHPTA